MRRWALGLVAAVLVWLVAWAAEPAVAVEAPSPPPGTIALTFDDGPNPAWTPQVLDLLDRYDAKATFFVVGYLAERHPDLVAEIARRGHTVANHSYSHPQLPTLSDDAIRDQLRVTDDAIAAAGVARPTCLRPPYGATNARVESVAAGAGLRTVLWTVDPEDWRRPGADALRARVARAGSGDIVGMHDGGGDRSHTVAALPGILEDLRARGLRSVSLCDTAPPAPVGSFELAADSGAPRQLRVAGWAAQRGRGEPVDVHVYVDGAGYNLGAATGHRPDVAAAVPGAGTGHGFDALVGPVPAGARQVCAFAVPRRGPSTVLGCRRAEVQAMWGALEAVWPGTTPGSVRAAGWALDLGGSAPAAVHLYIAGRGANLGPAEQWRGDLGAFGAGPWHGFDRQVIFPGLTGAHEACAYAVRQDLGAARLLRCTTVVLPADPLGSLELVRRGNDGTLRLAGWAVDPDTTGPVRIHAYAGGRGWDLGRAARTRPDLPGAVPGYGTAHGFDVTVAGLPLGAPDACVYAINEGRGTTTLLGCRALPGDPVGRLDGAHRTTDGSLVVNGWALDPNTTGPIDVHVYAGGRGWNLGPATRSRPDVARVFPAYGAGHGFAATLPGLPPGSRTVCAYGIGVGSGANSALGCRTIGPAITAAAEAPPGAPVGAEAPTG